MNNEDALLQIQSIPEKIWNQLSPSDEDAIEMAFNALEKQIPMNPVLGKDGVSKIMICPTCGNGIGYGNKNHNKYCQSCGQALSIGEILL